MPLNGEFHVVGTTDEGHRTGITFQNLTDVSMPILSVPMLCTQNDVNFTNKGGTITNKRTGEVSRFVKRMGVYFIRRRFKKSLVFGDSSIDDPMQSPENHEDHAMSDGITTFARPGNP